MKSWDIEREMFRTTSQSYTHSLYPLDLQGYSVYFGSHMETFKK